MKRGSLSIAIFGAVAASMAAVPGAADAQYQGGDYRQMRAYEGYRDVPGYHGGHGDRRVDYDRAYDGTGNRGRGYYGRHDRCRSDGTGGAIIGAIAGGLLGNAVAGYGDRAAGTILGGVGGALTGRAIDRNC